MQVLSYLKMSVLLCLKLTHHGVYDNFDIQAGPSEFKSPYRVAPTPVAIKGLMIFDLP